MERGPPTPRDAVESWYFPSPFANDNIPAQLTSIGARRSAWSAAPPLVLALFEAIDYTRVLGLTARRRTGVVTGSPTRASMGYLL